MSRGLFLVGLWGTPSTFDEKPGGYRRASCVAILEMHVPGSGSTSQGSELGASLVGWWKKKKVWCRVRKQGCRSWEKAMAGQIRKGLLGWCKDFSFLLWVRRQSHWKEWVEKCWVILHAHKISLIAVWWVFWRDARVEQEDRWRNDPDSP